jgi:hypothetical protein
MDAPRCRICGIRHWLDEPCQGKPDNKPKPKVRLSDAESTCDFALNDPRLTPAEQFDLQVDEVMHLARQCPLLLCNPKYITTARIEAAEKVIAAWLQVRRDLQALVRKRAKRGTFDRVKYHKEYMRKYMRTYLPKWRAKPHPKRSTTG